MGESAQTPKNHIWATEQSAFHSTEVKLREVSKFK